MILDATKRPELDPFSAPFFVLCEELCAGGMNLVFGDQLPSFIDLQHLHVHYRNGVVGTKEEFSSLNAPLKLYVSDPLQPIALFVGNPHSIEQAETVNPETLDNTGNKFLLENASLLKTKNDLIGYAKEFDITLVKATNISLTKMLETLKEEAITLGLIPKGS